MARHLGHERPGVILTLSEPGAKLAVSGILGHGVSAAGKEAFSRLLAAELAPGIRVVDIRPHAVVDAQAFPASDRAAAMTGTVANLSGGALVD